MFATCSDKKVGNILWGWRSQWMVLGTWRRLCVSGFVHFGILTVANNATCSLLSDSDFEKDIES